MDTINMDVSFPGLYSSGSGNSIQNRGNSEFLPPSADTCSRYQGLEGSFDANSPISSQASPGSMTEGLVWVAFYIREANTYVLMQVNGVETANLHKIQSY